MPSAWHCSPKDERTEKRSGLWDDEDEEDGYLHKPDIPLTPMTEGLSASGKPSFECLVCGRVMNKRNAKMHTYECCYESSHNADEYNNPAPIYKDETP
jgi:hypothetical protein